LAIVRRTCPKQHHHCLCVVSDLPKVQ
jgi:hypothetical protein